MSTIFQLLKYLPDLPSLLALFGDIQTLVKQFNEANVDKLVLDVKPVVAKYLPNVPPSELDAIATDLVALATLLTNQSATEIATALTVIVNSLPQFGVKVNADHVDAFIQAGVNLLADVGVK